jgi:glyoxylase-like metal-dependent hydrolase (beta-lactamase superfamily II)
MRTLFALLLLIAVAVPMQPAGLAQSASWSADIADIRRAANLIPGAKPTRINFLKFAASLRTKNFSVQGAPTSPSVQARTAFQVIYPDSYLMVDAGMDQAVHDFFGRGTKEPYDAAAAAQVAKAVAGARMILVTHEHGDHVAGVIRGAGAEQLAPKTILTRTQVDVLTTKPQMPELKLTPEQARRFIVVDYDKYLPVAPGIVLIKSAGHTPGSQMVFVSLASGREYLLIGDATWHMDGVRQVKGKDAPWVTEDVNAVLDQLRWLNQLTKTDTSLVIVASHDEEQHAELVQKKLLVHALELR